MVRIQVKHACRLRHRHRHRHGDEDESCELEFLHDLGSSHTTMDDISKEITAIANFQLQIHQLAIHLLPRLSLLLHTHPSVISLHRAISEATSYVSKDQVVHGKPLSRIALRGHLRSIESEFARSYQLLDFPDAKLERVLSDIDLLEEDSAQLWWAGKELMKGKKLADYIGKNDKTKITVRLLSSNLCPPTAREE